MFAEAVILSKTYDSKDIMVLEGLDAVRMRPGMYIGTTGIKGLHHILWEIVDNSMDELVNGFGTTIKVTLHEDGSAEVEEHCYYHAADNTCVLSG